MTEIQGKSILARVTARFEFARVLVIGSRLYINACASISSMALKIETLSFAVNRFRKKTKEQLKEHSEHK